MIPATAPTPIDAVDRQLAGKWRTSMPYGFFKKAGRSLSYSALLCVCIINEEQQKPRGKNQDAADWVKLSEQQLAEWIGVTDRAVRKALDEAERCIDNSDPANPLGVIRSKPDGKGRVYQVAHDYFRHLPYKEPKKLPTKAEREEKAKNTGTPVPVSLACPHGKTCPVEEAVQLEDGTVTNRPPEENTGTPVPVSEPKKRSSKLVNIVAKPTKQAESATDLIPQPMNGGADRSQSVTGLGAPERCQHSSDTGGALGAPDFSTVRAAIDKVCLPLLGKAVDDQILRGIQDRLARGNTPADSFIALLHRPATLNKLGGRNGSHGLLLLLADDAVRTWSALAQKPGSSAAPAAAPTREEMVAMLAQDMIWVEEFPGHVSTPDVQKRLSQAWADDPELYEAAQRRTEAFRGR